VPRSMFETKDSVVYLHTFFAFTRWAPCVAIRARRAALTFRLPGETGRIYFACSIL
jgi:hypothetical protein